MSENCNIKIFISGPMTGYENYNWDKFNEIERKLKENNIDCINPVNVCKKYKKEKVLTSLITYNMMIEEQLELLKTCNHILLLDGWNKSIGAKHELRTALDNDLIVILEHEVPCLNIYK
jgi:hypothetical protein